MNKIKQIINKVRGFFSRIFHKEEPGIVNKFKSNKAGILLIVLAIILGGLYYYRGLFIAAVVNGKIISRYQIINKLEKSGGKDILDTMITEILIDQEAKKLKVVPTDAEVKVEVDKVKAQYGTTLDSMLTFNKMTMKDLEDRIKIQLTIEKVLTDKIKVTEAEVNKYIEDNKSTIPADMSAEEVKIAVEQQIKSEKMGAEFEKWIEKTKALSDIQYLVKYE